MGATATRAPRGTTNGKVPPAELFEIPVDRIVVGDNVRADMGDLDMLATSIQEVGILQPLRVEQGDMDFYLLKIGHRRLAAAKQLGLTHVPAIVDTTLAMGGDRTIQQLVENIQRADLNALEEARALRAILDASKGMTQDQLAAKVGRSRPAVTNILRLLELDPKVIELIEREKLTAAHGKALLAYSGAGQRRMAKEAVEHGYSAHEVERRIQAERSQAEREAKEVDEARKHCARLEDLLREKGADKSTTTLVKSDYYGQSPLVKAMKSRGWKASDRYGEGRSKTCDCDAFKVWLSGYGREIKPTATRTCISDAHAAAKRKAEGASLDNRWKKDAEKREAEARERERIRQPLWLFLGANPRDVEARRATLYALAMSHYLQAGVLARRIDGEVDAYNPKKTWLAIAAISEKDLDGHIAALVAEKVVDKPLPVIVEALAAVVPGLAHSEAKEADPELPQLPDGLEWRRGRKTPSGGWLPVVHAFAVKAPTGAQGGSVAALAVCGLATGPIASPPLPVKRTIPCDQVLGLDDKRLSGLKPVPACTACVGTSTAVPSPQ